MIMKPFTNEILPQGYKMTELGALPDEWEVVKLGEVADIVMGQSPPGSSYNETGVGLPFLQGKAEFGPLHPLHIKYTTTPIKIAPKGSVLLSVRAPVGDVNLANIDYCIGRGLASISLSSGKNIFLFYILTYLKNEIEKEGTGSIFKAINKTKLLNFKIPLPPLPEQQKIAAVLSAVQEAKEKTEAVIAATKALKKSMMKHLFTYGPVSPQEAENVPLKETEIGPVPENWEVVRLDNEYIEFKNGLWKGKKGPYIKVKVLRNTNFNNDGTISFKDVAELNVEEKSFKDREIIKGDIILERSGGGPTQPVGRVVFFEKSDKFRYSFSNFTSRIRVTNELKIFPKFLFYFLFYFYYQGKTNDIQNRTTGIRNLDFSKYKQIPIPLPPLPIQQKIASILSAIDAKIEAEENKKQALEELFKTLLHNLMTAKIRVNHLEIKV